MKSPVTGPAKTRPILNIKSGFWEFAPAIFVVGREATTSLFAFFARVVCLEQNRHAPFSVLTPVTLSLSKPGFPSLEVPMSLSSVNGGQLRPARIGTCPFSTIRFVENVFSTHFTCEILSTNSVVRRYLSKVSSLLLFAPPRRSFNISIPWCWLSSPKVTGSKSWYSVFGKPISYRSTGALKLNCDFVWTYFFNTVQFTEKLFSRLFHGRSFRASGYASQHICTAANTWKRVAIATW